MDLATEDISVFNNFNINKPQDGFFKHLHISTSDLELSESLEETRKDENWIEDEDSLNSSLFDITGIGKSFYICNDLATNNFNSFLSSWTVSAIESSESRINPSNDSVNTSIWSSTERTSTTTSNSSNNFEIFRTLTSTESLDFSLLDRRDSVSEIRSFFNLSAFVTEKNRSDVEEPAVYRPCMEASENSKNPMCDISNFVQIEKHSIYNNSQHITKSNWNNSKCLTLYISTHTAHEELSRGGFRQL
ncbi:hypothetical protein HELRODRAFT_168993 [Helobdella robusta]|uniref:Uncharacterized protein n=1 Tax=Helobdella robusta TaxID=6412 RepID=T1F184_HELRO|nr:hypothetical protein HELRODRAFT_168993 [Helobdella robusta]ESO09057.1 hypothetical protein HELRODRAFT_168993 [Helobdella robusta]